MDKMVWAEYSSAGDELVEEATDVFLNCFDFEEPLSDELKETIGIDLPEGKEREAIVSMRMNQEFFRNTLLANYNSRCCLTGLSNKTLLVATHIKPWKVSGPKTERLAPDNDLLLNALHDKAFDRGLITITKDLKIMVSSVVEHETPEDEYLWRYNGEQIALPKRFAPRAEFMGGFSKNLKYKVPESLCRMVRQVDCGFESIDCRPKMDLDFLYIESPTSRLTWGVEVDSTKFVQQALLGVIEQEELVARGEVPFTQKRRNVRLLLSGAKQSLPVRDTLSYQVEGARIVAQAVGRLMRTSVKMPHVQVMLDRKIAGDCDFSFLHDLPMGYELEQVVGACAAVNNHMADKKQHAANKQQNLAAFRNNLAKEKHEKLAWKVTSLDAREEDLAAFDGERDFYLHHFCLPWEDLASYPARKSTALHMPFAASGYAYAQGGACKVPHFEFPSYEGEPVEQIAARLEERCRYNEGLEGAKVRQVSQAAARVPELLSIREVRERWSHDGVPAALQPAATAHMTPYMFQAVYLGGLGESAGRAVFEAYYDGRYSLARGDAAHAETGGDFEVLDAAGNKTGVWIDFKHYRIGTYEAYRRSGGETTDAECFKAKAQKVGAKRLLIVNVLADEAALELRQKPIDDVGMVYSFPYMAADGAISLEMMEAIGRAIEA